MIPRNRDEFMEYCLRKLGAPVIQINLDEEQINDRIDEALQFYQTYHYDAVERVIITYEVTQDDIDNKYLTIPNSILSVQRIVHDGGGFLKQKFGNPLWHAMKRTADDLNFGTGSCSSINSYYSMMMGYLAELEFSFNAKKSINFNYRSHLLHMNVDWNKYSVGDILAIECYRIVDPTVYGGVWGDRSLQNYTTSLIGENWGNVLSKYDNLQVVGGLTLNGEQIRDKYNEERVKIEEEWSLMYELPVDFSVG